MRTIQSTLGGFIVVTVGLWAWASAPKLAAATGLLAWRNQAVQLTGLVAVLAMALAMVLALRPRLLEQRLGGLDRVYRLHKWLGLTAAGAAVLHWAVIKLPKALAEAGLWQRPPRGPRQAAQDGLDSLLRLLRDPAEEVGDVLFKAALILIALALWRALPWRLFRFTHRWLAPLFLGLAFHSAVLTERQLWASPLGAWTIFWLAAGSLAAVPLFLRRAGARQRSTGRVERTEPLPQAGVLAVDVRLEGPWPGHRDGQFAFVTFHPQEGPHPFTITSSWLGDGRLRFLIRALGDYTRRLPVLLKAGDPVVIEGPYGRFDFADGLAHQVWVGAGIGIAPFVARMQALAALPPEQRTATIELIHPTAVEDPVALDRLRADAQAAGVRLVVLVDARDGRLTGERLRQLCPRWREAGIWFCGPMGLGDALEADLKAHGLPASRFHREWFELR